MLRTKRSMAVLALALAGISGVAEATTTVVYVNESLGSGGNDGTTWEDAFRGATALQDALTDAPNHISGGGDLVQIWVAEGTYKPSQKYFTGRSRSETFLMIDQVHLYGGFDSGCTTATCTSLVSDRAYSCTAGTGYVGRPCEVNADCGTSGTCGANATILSGDIDGAGSNDAFHVVTYDDADADVQINGFVITGGKADGNGPNDSPKGLDNQGGGLQIREMFKCPSGTFCGSDSDCSAETCSGGGECADGESCTFHVQCRVCGSSPLCLSGGPDIQNCLFHTNAASNHGGAVNDHGTSTAYDNCVFRDNEAPKGGAVLVDNGDASFTDCLFEDNSTTATPHEGGGLWLGERTSGEGAGCSADPGPTITDCVFEGNEAGLGAQTFDGEGGGLFSLNSHPTISGSTFTSNEASWEGGGIWAVGGALTLTDSDLVSNLSRVAGGGVFSEENAPTIDGCLFEANHARNENQYRSGGGLWHGNTPNGELTVIRNTHFIENYTSIIAGGGSGGAILADGDQGDTNYRTENCLFVGNYAAGGKGGAISENPGNATYSVVSSHVNDVFVANRAAEVGSADGRGGAIAYLLGTGNESRIVNCTFVENQSEGNNGNYAGGAVYRSSSVIDLEIYNSIFWANASAYTGDTAEEEQISYVGASPPLVINSVVDGLVSSGDFDSGSNTNNIDDDPLFIEDPDEGTAGWGAGGDDDYGDLRLDEGSPAGDAGDADDGGDDWFEDAGDMDEDASTSEDIPYDHNGNARVVDEVDMGAYESSNDWCDTSNDCEDANDCCHASTRICGGDEACMHSNVCCSGTCQECCDDSDCPLCCVSGSCELFCPN